MVISNEEGKGGRRRRVGERVEEGNDGRRKGGEEKGTEGWWRKGAEGLCYSKNSFKKPWS